MKKDIFELLKQDGPAAILPGSGLPMISIWKKATHYLIFFTLYPEQFVSHYDEEKKIYYLCLGDECLACVSDVKATEHIYLPAWDAQNRRIVALKFDTRPDGPGRKIHDFLATYRNQLSDIVAVLDCTGKDGAFTITARKPLPQTDRGALECKAFCDGLAAGAIDLRDCVKRLTVEEMAELPAVKQVPVPLVGDLVLPDLPEDPEESALVGEPVEPIADGEAS